MKDTIDGWWRLLIVGGKNKEKRSSAFLLVGMMPNDELGISLLMRKGMGDALGIIVLGDILGETFGG